MEKIKQFIMSEKGKDILVVIIVILVGFGAFELGRLSIQNPSNKAEMTAPSPNNNVVEPVNSPVLNTNTPISEAAANPPPAGKNFFASSKGSKYYPVNCSAGKTIKESNKIYFIDAAGAEKAGYTLSSSC